MGANFRPINDFVNNWCATNGVPYLVVCDESDTHGVMLFQKDQAVLNNFMSDLQPVLSKFKLHVESKRVRGGTVLAFSSQALSEDAMLAVLEALGEEVQPERFVDRVDKAFQTVEAPSLQTSARRIAEAQYHMATAGRFRANQSTRQRQMFGSNTTTGGVEHPDSPRAHSRRKSKKPQFEDKISDSFSLRRDYRRSHGFVNQLHEALGGIATPSGAQPSDLFQKFAQSLSVLGQQMGIGPLQDQLKKQGINWKKSDDGQAIILFVQNAQTNAPQPIARISAETLEKPSDFEQQLLAMIDFAKGQAPGAFKQQQEEIRAQEQAVRDIAKSVAPTDPNSAASQMQQQPQAPQQAAPVAASQQAGLPKNMGTPAVGGLPRRPA